MQKIKDTNLLLKSRKRFLLIIAVVILTIAYMTSTFSHKKVEIRLYGYWNMVLDSLVINRNTKLSLVLSKIYAIMLWYARIVENAFVQLQKLSEKYT